MLERMASPRIHSLDFRSKFRDGKLGVLAGRDFRRFYLGYSASLLGTAMSSVAIAFAVLGNGGTATDLGVVFAANIVPMIAFTLGGGAIADRLGRRPVMLAADVARCAAQGVLAVALQVGHPRWWLFAAAALVVGTGNAFFRPALAGLPVQLAPRSRLGDANALLAVAEPAAQVAGPALAGILIAATNPAIVVAADAASYAVSAVALAMLRFPSVDRSRPRSLLSDLGDWLGGIQRAFLAAGLDHPIRAVQPADLGAVPGAGSGTGPRLPGRRIGLGRDLGLLRRRRDPRRPARAGPPSAAPLAVANLATLGFPLPPLALALHLPAVAVAGGALLAGLGSALGSALEATVTQQRIPAPALSRVSAFNLVGGFAFGPVAFAAAGPVAAVVGARAVLGFGAAWAAFASIVVFAVPSVRHVTWLSASAQDQQASHGADPATRADEGNSAPSE